MEAKQVFLGGACGRTTWRKDIAIPILEEAGVTYHDPQMGVGEWTPDDEASEMLSKDESDVLIFVVSKETRGVAAVAEASYLIGAEVPVAVCLQFVEADTVIEGKKVTEYEADDLNRGRYFLKSMAEKHKVPVFEEVDATTRYAVELVQKGKSLLKLATLQEIVSCLEFKDMDFNVCPAFEGFLLWLSAREACAYTSEDTIQLGRKWFIPHDLKRSEVVKTAFKAVMTWQEHEAREHFKYRGHRIFGPHFSVKELSELCVRRKEKAANKNSGARDS